MGVTFTRPRLSTVTMLAFQKEQHPERRPRSSSHRLTPRRLGSGLGEDRSWRNVSPEMTVSSAAKNVGEYRRVGHDFKRAASSSEAPAAPHSLPSALGRDSMPTRPARIAPN